MNWKDSVSDLWVLWLIRPGSRGYILTRHYRSQNKKPPNIVGSTSSQIHLATVDWLYWPKQLIKKKDKGGIAISHTVPLTQLEEPEIKAVLAEYKLSNCDVSFRCDATIEEVCWPLKATSLFSEITSWLSLFAFTAHRCYRRQQNLHALRVSICSCPYKRSGDTDACFHIQLCPQQNRC